MPELTYNILKYDKKIPVCTEGNEELVVKEFSALEKICDDFGASRNINPENEFYEGEFAKVLSRRICRYFFSDGPTSAHIALTVDTIKGVAKALIKYNVASEPAALTAAFKEYFNVEPKIMVEKATKRF